MQVATVTGILRGCFELFGRNIRRLLASFLFALVLFGILYPSAIAAAATINTGPTASDVVNKNPHKTSTSPSIGAINTNAPPAPSTAGKSSYGAAADATTSVGAGSGLFNGLSKGLSNEPLSSSFITKPTFQPRELTNKRTATSSQLLNKDGSVTQTNYFSPHFYQNNGAWDTINTALSTDNNAADSGNVFGKALGAIESLVKSPNAYTVTGNSWLARFTPSDFSGGMLRIKQGTSQIGFSPIHANAVNPVITTDAKGQQTVHYDNLWNGVDITYLVESDQVKEAIVLKDKTAAAQIQFKIIGAGLQKPSQPADSKTIVPAFNIQGALNNQFSIAPANVILSNFGFVDNSTSGLTQSFQGDTLTVSVNSSYLKNLPSSAFPAVIDPTVYFGNRSGGNYESFETNGYNCPSNTCDLYAGSLHDSNNNLQYWRGAFFASYNMFQQSGTTLQSATLHVTQRSGVSWWTGYTGTYAYQVGNATCLSGYNCMDSYWDTGNVGSSGDINVTNIYQNLINNHNWGGWLMVAGEDGSGTLTWKTFDPDNSYVTFTYNNPIPSPTFAVPTNNQLFTDPQASFRLNTENNPNNSTPLQYQMVITDGSNGTVGTGTVISSGTPQNSTLWTVPDGVLQDGSTYYISALSYDPSTGLSSQPSAPMPFRIDTRTGNDKTQAYDTLGPVNVDLATGNLSTSAASHATKALAGSLGVNLNYNSPLKSRPGLVGTYWNASTNSFNNPNLVRVDQNVDFNWNGGSPSSTVNSTNFNAQWNGYFTAPVTGNYLFGATNDDGATITVNGQQVYNYANYSNTPYYQSQIWLTAGQVVPFQTTYTQVTGPDYIHLYVRGPVVEQVIPENWLQTGVRPVQQNNGLVGHYYSYTDNGNPPTIGSSSNTLFLTRTDPLINFNWNGGSPIPNGPQQDFLARWTGYVTVPTTGSYTFGTQSDDGSDVIVNNQSVYSKWSDSPGTIGYGSAVTLNAGQSYPITVDYYQHQGGDAMSLLVEPLGGASQTVPTSWLTPQAKVLPAGWGLGVSPDGSATYTHLTANQNNAILTDASGGSHDYTWTVNTNGVGGYTPPVNEYGHLIRNLDGTFTLQDSDGKTYIFDNAGNLTSLTNPVDDQHPAALKYTYGAINGTGPTAIQQITDGTTATRYANVYYGGVAQCGTPPSGFGTTPVDMICALQTNDGRTTNFYYDTNGNLAEVARPGNDNASYQYQAVLGSAGQTIGYQLTGVRDRLANDAVAAGTRANDGTTYTNVQYDSLGRIASVTAPAATAGATQLENTIQYLPGTTGYLNGYPSTGYFGATQEHIVGAAEPNGYTTRVEYDNLFRTTKQYDVQGLATTTEWNASKDLAYSTTNPEGLMTSTIYDDDDRAVTQYGPAPASWFNRWNWTLTSGQTMTEGQSIYSPDHRFQLAFQTDGNVMLYGPNGSLWGSGTNGQAATLLAMQTDGNLVIYNGGTAIWASNTSGNAGASLIMQNDGNVVLYNQTSAIWSTNTAGYAFNTTLSNTYNVPSSSYTSQVARTDTAYDQGMTGLAVAYTAVTEPSMNSASITGAPLLHGTNIATDGTISKDFGSTSPIPSYSGNWGLSMIGNMRLPTAGNWNFRITSDEGIRMWIDNQLVIDDWKDNTTTTSPTLSQTISHTPYTFNNTTASSLHSVRIDYYHLGGDANLTLYMTPPGGGETSQGAAAYFTPDYSLQTSTTSYDWTYGATTATTNYGSNPALGLDTNNTVDPSGLNLTTSKSYETPGSGYLRQTSKTSPGGSTSTYSYYGATDTAANPCVSGSTAAYQGGMLKSTTGPSPDNGTTVGITTASVYDNAGNVVATQTNQDGWDCKTYDARGRLTQEVVPAYNGQASRTITYNYNVGGNPLVTSETDSDGTITTTVDLLGRTVSYTDALSDTTTTAYDSLGRTQSQTSPMGTETYTYDSYNRLTDEQLGSIDLARPTYDQYGRLASVSDPSAGTLGETITYDTTTGNENAVTYAMAGGAIATNNITYSQSGKVINNVVTSGSQSLWNSYTYDLADRITQALIGPHTYTYGYGAQNSSCGTGSNMNSNAGKNSNRTSQSLDGATTTYCYNYADQLVSSSDSTASADQYDSHGNLTQIGSGSAPLHLYYDASDRNWGLVQYDGSGNGNGMYYSRDAQDRITYREHDTIAAWNWNMDAQYWYGYTGSGDSPGFVYNSAWNIVEEYVTLPGGVVVTIRPQQTTQASKYIYDLPNIHGDTLLTTDGTGANTSNGNGPAGSFTYDPFGNPLPGSHNPQNADYGSYGWEGGNQKMSETSLTLAPIQMGERVYLPTIGRFTSVDPVQGGNANLYIYPNDPVNLCDIAGTNQASDFLVATSKFIGRNSIVIGYGIEAVGLGAGIAVGLAGCTLATGGVCAVLFITAAAATYVGAANAGVGEYYASHSVSRAAFIAGLSVVTAHAADGLVESSAPLASQLVGKAEATAERTAGRDVSEALSTALARPAVRIVAVAVAHAAVGHVVSSEAQYTVDAPNLTPTMFLQPAAMGFSLQ